MAISRNTFTGDILCKLGYGDLLCANDHDSPGLSAEEMNDTDTFYLFSSESFPFQRHAEQLVSMGVDGAIVEGEGFSWFGIRSLRFLE